MRQPIIWVHPAETVLIFKFESLFLSEVKKC
jgi:hypothetical protein